MEKELRVLSPVSILGYGIPTESLRNGVARQPHVIGVDAGSTDMGAYFLATGHPYMNRSAVKRDARLLLEAQRDTGAVLIMGSVGGAGSNSHVDNMVEIIRETAAELDLHFPLARIYSEIDRKLVEAAMHEGRVRPLTGAPQVTPEEIDKISGPIVAQMGVDPIIAALDAGAKVVVAGRACDEAIFAAPGRRAGFPYPLALHMGKLLECGAACAAPRTGRDSVFAYLREDHFVIEPLNPSRRVTPQSLAAHMMHEVEHPFLHREVLGTLDLSGVEFEPALERGTRVSGSRFTPARTPTIKLEAATLAGYRSFVLGGMRDPILIQQLDQVLDGVRARAAEISEVPRDRYTLTYRVYGRNGVMGDLESVSTITSHEIALVADVVACTQDEAHAVCDIVFNGLLAFPYKGSIATTGNFACPFSPEVQDFGPVFRFLLFHVMEVADPTEHFPMELVKI